MKDFYNIKKTKQCNNVLKEKQVAKTPVCEFIMMFYITLMLLKLDNEIEWL